MKSVALCGRGVIIHHERPESMSSLISGQNELIDHVRTCKVRHIGEINTEGHTWDQLTSRIPILWPFGSKERHLLGRGAPFMYSETTVGSGSTRRLSHHPRSSSCCAHCRGPFEQWCRRITLKHHRTLPAHAPRPPVLNHRVEPKLSRTRRAFDMVPGGVTTREVVSLNQSHVGGLSAWTRRPFISS